MEGEGTGEEAGEGDEVEGTGGEAGGGDDVGVPVSEEPDEAARDVPSSKRAAEASIHRATVRARMEERQSKPEEPMPTESAPSASPGTAAVADIRRVRRIF